MRRLAIVANEPGRAADSATLLRALGYDAIPVEVPLDRWTGPWESGPEREPVWDPSPLVAAWTVRARSCNDVCDLACGSGRDAVYLAMSGLKVTAIDILPDALEIGRRLAERHGVDVRFRQGDLERDPGAWSGEWGLINVQRFLDRPGLPLLRERLRPGGLLLVETFLDAQAGAGRRPRNPVHLLRSGELRDALAPGLDLLHYREGLNDGGDWTVSLVARKPVVPKKVGGHDGKQD
jgi:tellurite methyltransferase